MLYVCFVFRLRTCPHHMSVACQSFLELTWYIWRITSFCSPPKPYGPSLADLRIDSVSLALSYTSLDNAARPWIIIIIIIIIINEWRLTRPIVVITTRSRNSLKIFKNSHVECVLCSIGIGLYGVYCIAWCACLLYPCRFRCYSFRLPTEGWPGWVDQGGWLYTEMIYRPADSHPSK